MKLLPTIFLFIFLGLCQFSPAMANESQTKFYQISYQDKALANKILISLHHGVMEVNREEQFIIAQLTSEERELLASLPVQLTQAIAWQEKFEQFISSKTMSTPVQKSAGEKVSQPISGFECYATVEDTYQQAEDMAAQYSHLASWIDIGDSWNKVNLSNGYDLMVLKITNSEKVAEKPILFVHSSMHAREYTPAQLNLDFAKWLLDNYQDNAEAKWIVDNREVHLLFHMNPDGRKIAEQQVMQRKNTNQNHCPNSTVGVDLNRNFAFTWGSTLNGSSGDACSEVYRGVSAESEPETQAVSNYIRSLFPDERGELPEDAAPQDKSGLHLDIHSYGRLVLWPNGHTEEPSGNDQGFVHLGHKLAWFNNYQPQQSIGLYPTDGTSDNVSYGELGVAALTFELGSSFFEGCSQYEQSIKPDNLKALIYAAKVSKAPYLLSLGADISLITVNQSLDQTTVKEGAIVELYIKATGKQSKLANLDKAITSFEYVIDGTFDEIEKVIAIDQGVEHESDGVAVVSTQIDTAGLAEGQHVLTVRAKDEQGNYGVASSVLITIAQNSAPVPSFTANCQNQNCTFDASQSQDADGDIVKYQWSAYQGNQLPEVIGEGQTLQHSFTVTGDVTIELELEDGSGLQASTKQTVNLTAIEVITVTPESSSNGSGGVVFWLTFGVFIRLLFRLTAIKRH